MDLENQDAAAQLDVLDSGDPPVRRWPRRSWLLFLGFLLLIVVGATWLDRRERLQEFERMMTCSRAGHEAVGYASGSVTAMSQYVRPALGSAPPESVRAGLHRLIQESAAQGFSAVERARHDCLAVSALPWHRDISHARSTYLDYLDAWLDYLDGTAMDDRELFEEHPELRSRLAAARAALSSSAPSAADAHLTRTLLADPLG